MTDNSHSDYSRYFSLKQRVYLINMSTERDIEEFESLSGIISSRHGDRIDLHLPYSIGLESPAITGYTTSFKLTSESMGSGIQVMTDLLDIVQGNVFQLKLRGTLEMFQRRTSVRVDTTAGFYQLKRDFSLSFYRKEWRRVTAYLKTKGLPPNLPLHMTHLNLSMGGIRVAAEPREQQSPLSMVFIDLNDGTYPVCAVAEAVWSRKDDDEIVTGHRFIQILKHDQERLNRYVVDLLKNQGADVPLGKKNWELLDQMIYSHEQLESKR